MPKRVRRENSPYGMFLITLVIADSWPTGEIHERQPWGGLIFLANYCGPPKPETILCETRHFLANDFAVEARIRVIALPGRKVLDSYSFVRLSNDLKH